MEKLSNNFENTLIVDKKENFEEWQDRIVDQIHSIILKSNSLQDYSAHYNNLTS
ncbi:hypothetical protein HOG21_07885 [bacterium]|nr:hypothetical protein [bacterium]